MQTTTSATVQIVPTNERASRIARLTATAEAAGWDVTATQITAAVDAAAAVEATIRREIAEEADLAA